MPRQFKRGDVVKLRSGGPLMTVEDIEDDGKIVSCDFFTKEELFIEKRPFYPEQLILQCPYKEDVTP